MEVRKNVVTNSNGIWDSDAAKMDLQVGNYQVKEVATVQGYLLDSTVRTNYSKRQGTKSQ